MTEIFRETEVLAVRLLRVLEVSFKRLAQRRSPMSGDHPFKKLTGNQIRALHLLHQAPGLLQKDLAEHMCITPAAISTAVREMEGLGLIERRPDPSDARSIQLYASERAQQMIHEGVKVQTRAVAELLEVLPIEEQRLIVEILEKAIRLKGEEPGTGPPVWPVRPARD